jgi:hypothetical protein
MGAVGLLKKTSPAPLEMGGGVVAVKLGLITTLTERFLYKEISSENLDRNACIPIRFSNITQLIYY